MVPLGQASGNDRPILDIAAAPTTAELGGRELELIPHDIALARDVIGRLRDLRDARLGAGQWRQERRYAGIGHGRNHTGRIVLVQKNERPPSSIRLGEKREFRGAAECCDLGSNRRSPDGHGGHGRIDLEVAGLANPSCDEADDALNKREQRRVRARIRRVDQVVQHHAGTGRQAEHCSIIEFESQ